MPVGPTTGGLNLRTDLSFRPRSIFREPASEVDYERFLSENAQRERDADIRGKEEDNATKIKNRKLIDAEIARMGAQTHHFGAETQRLMTAAGLDITKVAEEIRSNMARERQNDRGLDIQDRAQRAGAVSDARRTTVTERLGNQQNQNDAARIAEQSRSNRAQESVAGQNARTNQDQVLFHNMPLDQAGQRATAAYDARPENQAAWQQRVQNDDAIRRRSERIKREETVKANNRGDVLALPPGVELPENMILSQPGQGKPRILSYSGPLKGKRSFLHEGAAGGLEEDIEVDDLVIAFDPNTDEVIELDPSLGVKGESPRNKFWGTDISGKNARGERKGYVSPDALRKGKMQDVIKYLSQFKQKKDRPLEESFGVATPPVARVVAPPPVTIGGQDIRDPMNSGQPVPQLNWFETNPAGDPGLGGIVPQGPLFEGLTPGPVIQPQPEMTLRPRRNPYQR